MELGRWSAANSPYEPDCEWVIRTIGASLSINGTRASRLSAWVTSGFCTNGNDHQRIGLREARRNLVLDVGLTAQHLLVAGRHILAADEEVALLGDRQRFLGTD